MAVARRSLLALGAAAAVSLATSACTPEDSITRSDLPQPTRSPTKTRPTKAPSLSTGPAVQTFAGQPPPGDLYYGASVPHHRSLSAWERRLGTPLALNRSYFTPARNEELQMFRVCRDDLAHGRLPHVSIKAHGTWQDVGSGRRDPWLSALLEPLAQLDGPVFLTLHHEPANDAGPPGMMPADFVAMQRRAISFAADIAPQVTIVPVLQQWTFDPSNPDVDPSIWLVPEAAVIGLDVYNPWSPTNGKAWRSFGSKVDEVKAWFDGVPLAIGEYGCREDPDVPGLAAHWLRDAVDYARSNNIVSMSYFNSHVGSEDGTWQLTGETEQTFAELLTGDWVTRPA